VSPCVAASRPQVTTLLATHLKLNRTYIRKLKYKFQFLLVLGRFSAELGPGTVTNCSGLKDAASINQD
jgi:hypothetical protein